MFGWLAHALASLHAGNGTDDLAVSRCAMPMSGPELAARLPMLGSVLYLPTRKAPSRGWPLPAGWLASRHELAPLLATRELCVASMVGVDGPREWIDCIDAEGRFCARLHLLPDTDYLAWDALLSRGRPLPPLPWRSECAACRAASAELVHFRTRRLGGLELLEALPLSRLSILGQDIAREVARASDVTLEPALD
ncbi:hypothetical protein [Dyella sedimenti]|uniref:hypothetical protein n=1 Tax=Dyella sedimenti TaxID=2919947 RepID=UPI001FAA671E|nr:hypothetical protein [Dyella sedimenti]